MYDGIYTVIFNLSNMQSSVVITINNSIITGGNTEYYYKGSCNIDKTKLTGSMKGIHFFGSPDARLGGMKEINITLQGEFKNDEIHGVATILGLQIKIPFIGKKRI